MLKGDEELSFMICILLDYNTFDIYSPAALTSFALWWECW